MTAQTVTVPDVMPARLDRMKDIPAGLSIPERSAYLAGYSRAMRTYVKKHGAPSLQDPVPAAGTAARVMFGRRLSELTRAFELESHPPAHKAGMSALTRYRKLRGIVAPAEVKPAAVPVERKPRKTSRFVLCDAHAGHSLTRRELAQWFAEGGLRGACTSGDSMCHVVPGTDLYNPDTVTSDLWTGNASAPVETPAATPADVLSTGVESGRVAIIPVSFTPAPVEPAAEAAVKPANRTRRLARRELAATMRTAGVVPAGEAWEAAKRDAGLS